MKDDQVKIGGFRIELQEIEAVYASHALVEKAVALVKGASAPRLVVFLEPTDVVSASGGYNDHDLQEIASHAGRSLTYYMMPKATVVVNKFPQTANGKLDKLALMALPEVRFLLGEDFCNSR